jgi:dipeptide/tripeptide permease
MPLYFQAVLQESAGNASAHLLAPSIAFTVVSGLTGSIIARWKTAAPTLYLSQFFLFLGSVCLIFMTLTFPQNHAPSWGYSLIIIWPSVGASMMAPSALLSLLKLSDDSSHAIANSSFIMARSLGTFIATALSGAIIQNYFRSSFNMQEFSEETTAVSTS